MLDDLVGQDLGPYPFRIAHEKVNEFIAATADDRLRWTATAPPAFAAAGLFAAAAPFLAHEAVRREGSSILHGEQAFRWHGPLEIGMEVAVAARLRRVRRRGGTTFVWFTAGLRTERAPLVDSDSLFLLGDPDGTITAEELPEPGPLDRAISEEPSPISLPAAGEDLPILRKSASRADLLHYAAATGDWNPIHWDHVSAVEAGLPGVICHGLLLGAWLLQAASRTSPLSDPISQARIRFRAPVAPAIQAAVEGRVVEHVGDETTLQISITSAQIEHAAATVSVR